MGEHDQAEQSPGGAFVLLEVLARWDVAEEQVIGDCPVGTWQKARCPKCRYEEITQA